ncbi:MAG: hypothetical protein IT289_11115 [Oligoflexia bacterium]|nr:hypothetical protein [Oligoflexia bacterium]
MTKIILSIFFLKAAVVASNLAATPPPYWKTKPHLVKAIKEDREVLVNVKTLESQGLESLLMQSAGQIRAPIDFVHERVTSYDRYSELLPYIEESKYDPVTKKLFIHCSLLGFHARMTMAMSSLKTTQGYRTQFEVISGSFVGMKGHVTEDADGARFTEISMEGEFKAEDLPIPKIITSLALEFAGRRMASRMRSSIEEDWAREQKSN